jgi:hypothetical protein
MIKFIADTHSYSSLEGEEQIDWVSVTRLIHHFKEPFDPIAVSIRCSKGKNPKYKGKTPEEIRAIWDKENKRSVTLGSWFHDQREKQTLDCRTITRDGIELPIISPVMDGYVKYAPSQKLTDGVYPEHMVYLKSAGVCGQADRIEVVNGVVEVHDYKTNKEIKFKGYEFFDGSVKKMKGPLSHLEDCEFNDYALQLSTYMYIILKHNYNLLPGLIQIAHIEFEVEGLDENGYPITALDPMGEPIVKKVNHIEVPYLKKEVISMFRWLDTNREKVLSKTH